MIADFKISRLSEVCTIIAGQSPESKYYNKDGVGIPFFQGKADFGPLYPEITTYCSQPKKIAEKDDILLSVRAPVGPTNLAPCRVCIGRGLSAIRPNDKLTIKFVLLFFKYFEAQLSHKGTGTTFKAITQDVVKNLMIPVPPLSEQERIVAKIEELFSQLDAAVAELKSVKEKLVIYRQAALKEAFEKYNKGMVQLKHIAVSRLGKMLDKSKNTGNTHKYLRNINVRWLGFDTTDLLDIKIEDYEVEKFSIAFDDLIMCEGGEPGRCAVWKNKESICFQKALHRIRFLDDSIPEFYMYLFYYYAQTGVLKPYFTGSGIKHLTGEKLETVLVPKAPRDEQNSTVNYIEKKLSICNNIEQTVDTALQQAAALRQSILKQAFEGNL